MGLWSREPRNSISIVLHPFYHLYPQAHGRTCTDHLQILTFRHLCSSVLHVHLLAPPPPGAPALSPGSHVLGPFCLIRPPPEVAAGCVCSPVLSLLGTCVRCWVLRACSLASPRSLLCVCAPGSVVEDIWEVLG